MSKCCKTCPFLPGNANKPTPPGFKEDNPDAPDWFTDEHLVELWDGIREGQFLACHSTIEDRAKYVGKGVEDNSKARLCTGALVAGYAHLKMYEKVAEEMPDCEDSDEIYKEYRRRAGDRPFSLGGLTSIVAALAFGQTDIFGGLPVPRNFTPPKSLRTAWTDPVIENFKTLI